MAFLDNSGDIILDAVLTDTGRFRMARGDFRISKFALGDDEIDYSLFNKNHPSGSAYYDLEVLRTPLLEAFTNNTSTMKSKLLTITRTNILHLPILKLLDGGNTQSGGSVQDTGGFRNTKVNGSTKGYIITVDSTTETDTYLQSTTPNGTSATTGRGIMLGSDDSTLLNSNNFICLERGLDTTEISPSVTMPASLQETQFIIEMDYRLGTLTPRSSDQEMPVSFIDDDQIASFYVSEGTNEASSAVVLPQIDQLRVDTADSNDRFSMHTVQGPRDRILQFKIRPSINLRTSDYLFDKLGSTFVNVDGSANNKEGFKSTSGSGFTFKFIDTIVRVTSATTAYSIDIPIRYVKASV